MKKTSLWIYIGLCLIGLGGILFAGAMTLLKWDFTKLSTIHYQTKEHVLEESFTHIAIEADTANITFLPSDNGQTRVVCREQERLTHTVTVQEDTLTITVRDDRKWYDHVGIQFGSTEITLYLPGEVYGKIAVKTSTGRVQLPEDVTVSSVDIQVSTGDIRLSRITCQEDISVKVSTGRVKMEDVTCKRFLSTGSTGSVSLKNVLAAEKMDIRRSTGNVRFDGCDAGEILVDTDTGDIRGSLLSEKIFTAHTDTGKIQVPKSTVGGVCDMTTDTGDIIIEYTK